MIIGTNVSQNERAVILSDDTCGSVDRFERIVIKIDWGAA
jgi:hypothetical protein